MPYMIGIHLLAVFALGAVVGAGLEWTATTGLHSYTGATVPDRRPELPTVSALTAIPDHCANGDLASPAADPARIKGAGLERWWMDVEQSVKARGIGRRSLSLPASRRAVMQNHVLVGRITGLRLFSVPEFGTRASFKLECRERGSVTCAVEGDVTREFLSYCREGDLVALTGVDEPRPSTASLNTPWSGRFRVRALRVLESASLAA